MTPVAVVIPTFDEAAELPAALALLTRDPPCPLEVVVADGGSRDSTVEVAKAAGVRVVRCRRGRAAQMNAGARASSGDPLVFLHADSRIDRRHLAALLAALDDPAVVFGAFPLRLAARGAFFRLVERAANFRLRLDSTPYGDQAIFCRRAAFDAAGGFPEVAIGEDIALVRALRRHGRFRRLDGPPVETSARRWLGEGRGLTLVRNGLARALLEAGVAPARVRRLYDRLGPRL